MRGAYIRVGLYIRGGGAYIWNEVSVSTCGGLIHGGAYIRCGLIFGVGLYSEVYGTQTENLVSKFSK
jgi:hypothetical protein